MSSNSDVSSHNYGVPLGRKEVEHNDIPESVQAALRADIDNRLETYGNASIKANDPAEVGPITSGGSALPHSYASLLAAHADSSPPTSHDTDKVDNLLANIMEGQRQLYYPKAGYVAPGDMNSSFAVQYREIETSPSDTGSYAADHTPGKDSKAGKVKDPEKERLHKQLNDMKAHLARLEAEHTRDQNAKNAFNLAAPPFNLDSSQFSSNGMSTGDDAKTSPPANATNAGQANNSLGVWVRADDSRSEMSDAASARGLGNGASIWNTPANTGNGIGLGLQQSASGGSSLPYNQWAMNNARIWPSAGYGQSQGLQATGQRLFSGQGLGQMDTLGPLGNDLNAFHAGLQQRRASAQLGSANPMGVFGQAQAQAQPQAQGQAQGQTQLGQLHNTSQFPQLGPMNNLAQMPQFNQRRPSFISSFGNPAATTQQAIQPPGQTSAVASYQPRPIGTPLSPTAAEFNSSTLNPWNPTTPPAQSQTFLANAEPVNYRRLLDRTVTCDWKYIVDKIICSNDQQASIFLQQKLKLGTDEQRFTIIESIVAQAYPLMTNRFGNFLVQRCFEHGTPEQIVAIGNIIRGNTLNLSMDPFGCHVIQKAFDAVPEEMKAAMVHELLRRIPETVVHRYACHVWQKLFELRWSGDPPQIMKAVNVALEGGWHEVAQGETGSLVVQNVFENCLEEDKRLCINEVLKSIDVIARGQFGNWCVQHICEHGSPADRSYAIDHVLRNATEYSMDQFASKVVEKCLKVGGAEFLESYLERICEGRPDRPRIPLIDISSDQYGNYLIQYILGHANPHHREVVAGHVRKHMVSLRGSKYGARVGMLCSNPAVATRPGPPFAPQAPRLQIEAPHPTRYGINFR